MNEDNNTSFENRKQEIADSLTNRQMTIIKMQSNIIGLNNGELDELSENVMFYQPGLKRINLERYRKDC